MIKEGAIQRNLLSNYWSILPLLLLVGFVVYGSRLAFCFSPFNLKSAGRGFKEGAVSEKQTTSSYTYWIREVTEDAAPLPVPRKLTQEDLLAQQSHSSTLGSVWNKAGTWEEKNLNKWASDKLKELLSAVGSLTFSGGKAEITEVSRCSGDMEVKLSEEKDLLHQDKLQISQDIKRHFLQLLWEKLLQFEEELKDR